VTSDLERLVRGRLHTELDQLVPEGISPPADLGVHRSPSAPADTQRHPRRGWRIPLLAAAAVAVIALVTIPLIRNGGPTTGSPPNPAAVAASKSYVPVGPAMTTLALGRAVKLLTSWDQAAPGHPAPTNFGPDNAQISGTAAGQGISSIHVNGAVLTVEFTGGTLPKDQDCGYDYTASALASTRAVAIFTHADPGTWPNGPDVNCAYVATTKTLTITLPEPLGNRSLLDVTTGSLIVPNP